MANDPLYRALKALPREYERSGSRLPYEDPTGDRGAALADRRPVHDTSGVEHLADITQAIRGRGRGRQRITNDDAAQILIACATLTPEQLVQASAYIPEARSA